jgi:hypothetical protein
MLASGDGTYWDQLGNYFEAHPGVEQQVGEDADRRPLSRLELDRDGLAPIRLVETSPDGAA